MTVPCPNRQIIAVADGSRPGSDAPAYYFDSDEYAQTRSGTTALNRYSLADGSLVSADSLGALSLVGKAAFDGVGGVYTVSSNNLYRSTGGGVQTLIGSTGLTATSWWCDWSPYDGNIYALRVTSPSARMTRIDPTTGTATDLGAISISGIGVLTTFDVAATSEGAVFVNASPSTTNIYGYDIVTNTFLTRTLRTIGLGPGVWALTVLPDGGILYLSQTGSTQHSYINRADFFASQSPQAFAPCSIDPDNIYGGRQDPSGLSSLVQTNTGAPDFLDTTLEWVARRRWWAGVAGTG